MNDFRSPMTPGIYIVHPEMMPDLMGIPGFVPVCQYKNQEVLPGELGGFWSSIGTRIDVRIIEQTAIYKEPERIEVQVRLGQMPEPPELFRMVEHPLGLCPFPLTPVALACMGPDG